MIPASSQSFGSWKGTDSKLRSEQELPPIFALSLYYESESYFGSEQDCAFLHVFHGTSDHALISRGFTRNIAMVLLLGIRDKSVKENLLMVWD